MCHAGEITNIINYRRSYEKSNSMFHNATPQEIDATGLDRLYEVDQARTQQLETERRYFTERLDSLKLRVIETEVKMDITRRWQPTDPQYIETMRHASMRHYHRALDRLQKLVVQRLFEIQRLFLSQTGM